MDEYGKMGPHRHKRAGITGKLLMLGIIVLIIVIAVFAYYFIGGPINVGGPTTIPLTSKGSVFAISGKSYVATLAGYNNNTKTAYVYISGIPVFLGPVLNVTLQQNNTVKVNYNSQYAIMQFKLLSGNKDSINLQVAPLAASLQVDPDYQYIGHPNVSVPGLHITTTTTVTATTTVSNSVSNTTASTTAASTTVQGSTTTVKATTTVGATNYTASAINAAAKADDNYGLMLNFTSIYNQTLYCTPGTYNLSYFHQNGALPVPPFDFDNVTRETPYGMVQKTVQTGGNTYAVEFKPIVTDPLYNGTPALAIEITVASQGTSAALGTVTANNYNGIFKDGTYQQLSSLYTQSKAVNNNCDAMVG
jgi:hypothetical protein